jgi:hypothetical protein
MLRGRGNSLVFRLQVGITGVLAGDVALAGVSAMPVKVPSSDDWRQRRRLCVAINKDSRSQRISDESSSRWPMISQEVLKGWIVLVGWHWPDRRPDLFLRQVSQ